MGRILVSQLLTKGAKIRIKVSPWQLANIVKKDFLSDFQTLCHNNISEERKKAKNLGNDIFELTCQTIPFGPWALYSPPRSPHRRRSCEQQLGRCGRQSCRTLTFCRRGWQRGTWQWFWSLSSGGLNWEAGPWASIDFLRGYLALTHSAGRLTGVQFPRKWIRGYLVALCGWCDILPCAPQLAV